jgi:putative phosphoribosyl transferase
VLRGRERGFADRTAAGRELGRLLTGAARDDPLVLGLPRGGVPVAAEVARALGAPLDVFVARKIGAPGRPELGVGAIAEGGEPVYDADLLARLGLTVTDLTGTVATERAELYRRVRQYRGARTLQLAGREVVLVDDGLATGGSARAALRALRSLGAGWLLLGVPVGPPSTLSALAAEADEVVAVLTPARLSSVGEWYDDFTQTSDETVLALLAEHSG